MLTVCCEQHRHVFHYVCQDMITYLCMTDEQFSRSLAFAFLEDIQHRFRASYGDRGKTALSMAMNAEFSHVLQRQMDYFSNNPNADKLRQAGAQVDEVKAIMVNNIEQVLERGDKIDVLVDKTEGLYSNASTFKHQATHLKRAMMWKNIKLGLIIGFSVLVCQSSYHVAYEDLPFFFLLCSWFILKCTGFISKLRFTSYVGAYNTLLHSFVCSLLV